MKCHLYENNTCIVKKFCSNEKILNHDCQNNIDTCSFTIKSNFIIYNEVKIKIKQVTNPYSVISDLLIYPTNPELSIDDPLIIKMGSEHLDKECSKYKSTAKMGGFYVISENIKNTLIKSKKLGLAVIAVPSGLVNEQILKLTTIKSILVADEMKCETITMLPGDFGTHNLQLVALHQIRGIITALKDKPKHLKNIFIIMQDKPTEKIFIDYLNRINEGLDSNLD